MGYRKGVFTVRDNKCFLDDEVILDYNDRIHNYSRVPLHRMYDNGRIILSELITKNYNDQKRIDEGKPIEELSFHFCVLDCIMSKYFLSCSHPINVCEIGCDNGSFSAHIAPTVAEFFPANDYVCVCSSIGNQSGNSWLDHVSQVKSPDGLSLVAADLAHTNLRDGYFGLTIINGTVPVADPMNTIREALRITSDDGCILCFSNSQYLLEDTFRLMFSERKEWQFSSEQSFFWVKKSDAWCMK